MSDVAVAAFVAVLTSTSASIYNDPNLHLLNFKSREHLNSLIQNGIEAQKEDLTVPIFIYSFLNLVAFESVLAKNLALYTTLSLQSLSEKQLDPSIVNLETQEVQNVGSLTQVAHGNVQARH